MNDLVNSLDDTDDRPAVVALLANIKAALPALEVLLTETERDAEDGIYRFYHQSFKVFHLQSDTEGIVAALAALAPGRPLDEWFVRIVTGGTGRSFKQADNSRWPEATRPIVEAFFHARYFLEMAIKYGKLLERPPAMIPSGWAAVLSLYGLR